MERLVLLESIDTPCDLIIYDEVDSTNDAAKRLFVERADTSSEMPLVVLADRQTAGRGRLGREWASPFGGVYLSVSVPLDVVDERLSALPLVVACAVFEALERLVHEYAGDRKTALELFEYTEDAYVGRIRIKWPNDILVVGGTHVGKLAGILAETIGSRKDSRGVGIVQAIIGVGINVARPSAGADGRACYLSDLLPEIGVQTCAAVAARTIDAICEELGRWRAEAFSFAPFHDGYVARMALLGEGAHDDVLKTGT